MLCLCFFIFLHSLKYILDLQCCINFCRAAVVHLYRYTHILFHSLFLYGLSQDSEYSSLGLLFIHPVYNPKFPILPSPDSKALPLNNSKPKAIPHSWKDCRTYCRHQGHKKSRGVGSIQIACCAHIENRWVLKNESGLLKI